MNIRKARIEDVDNIMPIYDRARAFMAANGNPNQWGDGYPQREVIEAGNFYVCVDDDVAEKCFAWCGNQCENLRIDTHKDNRIMQHVIEKAGFIKCGIIYVRDGTPRMAFQRVE